MAADLMLILEKAMQAWRPPEVPADIPQGDTPGDKIWIGPQQQEKAAKIFPEILPILYEVLEKSPEKRAIITVCGGSGVGKTGISSLLTYFFNQLGIGCYTLSGDNYPRRIPSLNDAERMRIYRLAGIRGMLEQNVYTSDTARELKVLQETETDSEPQEADGRPWLTVYQKAGRESLAEYLCSEQEQEFDVLTKTLTQFKNGAEKIWLKRMGRTETELWYEKKDFRGVSVLILEWTHGNCRKFEGVDIPILLNSTPAETREYRLLRARDANTDTPFISMVLEIEQGMLEKQAHAAKLILSKSGDFLTYAQFKRQMDTGR